MAQDTPDDDKSQSIMDGRLREGIPFNRVDQYSTGHHGTMGSADTRQDPNNGQCHGPTSVNCDPMLYALSS